MTKKEKVHYVDDGRTVADMSGVTGSRPRRKEPVGSSFRDKWNTYWAAVRMMFLPMLAVIGGLAVIYLILWFLFSLA